MGSVTFIVMFTTFFVSLMPQPVGVQVGDVSAVDIKAPREVIDVAATEALRKQAAANVPEQWRRTRKDWPTKTQASQFREAVRDCKGQGLLQLKRLSGLYALPESVDVRLRYYSPFAASQPELLDTGVARLLEVLEEGLSAGIKSENLSSKAAMVSELSAASRDPGTYYRSPLALSLIRT